MKNNEKRVSRVVNGKAHSIEQLLQKRAAGMRVGIDLRKSINKDQDFDGVDLEKFRDMDFYERQVFVKERKKLAVNAVKNAIERKRVKDEKDKMKLEEAEFERLMKASDLDKEKKTE